MATGMFPETLDNFYIRRGSSPKAEIVHWAPATKIKNIKYYLLFILEIRDKRIILKPHTASIIRAMIAKY
jgi:hypothetical protein